MFKQIEILLEGWNPDADAPLTDADLARVRAAARGAQPVDPVRAFVRGRVLRAGAAAWVATDKHLVLLHTARGRGDQALAWNQVQDLTLQPGRYGMALALQAGAQRHSMFAADPDMARAFAAFMVQHQGRSTATSAAKTTVVA